MKRREWNKLVDDLFALDREYPYLGQTVEGSVQKYDPNQPRVPAGSPEGGQWTDGAIGMETYQMGQNGRPPTTDELAYWLDEDEWPELEAGEFRIHSGLDTEYNCLGEAVGDRDRWWWPSGGMSSMFWPSGVEDFGVTIESFDELFINVAKGQYINPRASDSLAYEKGYVKLALFGNEFDEPTHISRLLPTGEWTNKMGANATLILDDVRNLEGGFYGNIEAIYKVPEAEWEKLRYMK